MTDPALVVDVDATGEEVIAEVRGTRRRLSIGLLTLEGTRVEPGDWLLATAGIAVERLDERQAIELAALVARAHGEEEPG